MSCQVCIYLKVTYTLELYHYLSLMGIRKGLNTLLHLEQSFSSSKDCLKQRHCRGKIAQTDKQNDRRLDKLSVFKLKLFNKILIAFFFTNSDV